MFSTRSVVSCSLGSLFLSAALGLVLLSGCSQDAGDRPSVPDAQPSQSEDTSPAQTPETAPEEGTSAPEDSASAQPEQEQPEKNKVLLGAAELTTGIPGEGPLKLAEINSWLADEKNHQVLDVQLPEGLSAGQDAIKGLEANPLTRAKIELGRQLYFDGRLSADSKISCASCHDPDYGYAKDTQFGVGIEGQTGGRNSPVAYNRILSDKQFWDGRAESLEAQAVGPIANPIEMGNTHEVCVKTLQDIEGYRVQFEKIFDDGVTIDNVGRAIASFERVIVTGTSLADHYEFVRNVKKQFGEDGVDDLKEDDPALYARYEAAVAGSEGMSEAARRGRELFFSNSVGCTACHVGANFTDEKYHNLGVGMDADEPDVGREAVTGEEKDRGAFKTPTIRNVALSAPYMHDGSQKTLEEVVEWYAKGGHPNPYLSEKIKKLDLTDQDKQDLVAYMKALTGPFPKVERKRLPE